MSTMLLFAPARARPTTQHASDVRPSDVSLGVLKPASLASMPTARPRPTAAPSPARPSRSDARLTWAPPRCGDASHACATFTVQNTGSHQFLDLNKAEDWIVKLPPVPVVGGLDIDGGHNVIIIGGQVDLATPCTTDSDECHGINISRTATSTGEVYIEGVLIRNPDPTHSKYTGDGIDVNTAATSRITIQNVRVEGIDGCDANGSSAHADVFQPYGARGAVIQVDHLTGTSDFQGMEINPDASTPSSGIYKNVNLDVLRNPHAGCAGYGGNRYMWWLTAGNNGCATYPMTLTNAYAGEPSGSLQHDGVWPDTDSSLGCDAQYRGGLVTWPALPAVTGAVRTGAPAGGDYVPVGVAGITYVSPGYLS